MLHSHKTPTLKAFPGKPCTERSAGRCVRAPATRAPAPAAPLAGAATAGRSRRLLVRALGVRISVYRPLHLFCTTFSVQQLCSVLRPRPNPPPARRAPGPCILCPGRCGWARFCAPCLSRRPAALRVPDPTRKALAPRARIPPCFRSQPAGSPEHAVHSCTCYFTVPVLRQARNASTQQQTGTGATNSWLFCCPRGHRFAAAAAIPDGRATLSRAA